MKIVGGGSLSAMAGLGLLLSGCAQGDEAAWERTCDRVDAAPEGAELTPIGASGRWSMSATSGTVTCSEPVGEAFGCVFLGPATVHVSSAAAAEAHTFVAAEGEMAAVTISDDAVSCSLRSAR